MSLYVSSVCGSPLHPLLFYHNLFVGKTWLFVLGSLPLHCLLTRPLLVCESSLTRRHVQIPLV